ncbi:MAG: DNA-processing protein DprA [Pseudolabrys sp.]
MDDQTRLDDDDRIDWLRLIRSDNVGPRTFHDLVSYCGGVRPALAALPGLARRGGSAQSPRIFSREQAEAELNAARAAGVEFFTLGDSEYPSRLKMIADPPPVIAVRGKFDALARPSIAIVGSRNASAAGVKFAERIARDLGDAGFAVVSGLARGIDAAAHRASLTTGTIAVLAGGHDRIYPPEHIELLEKIAVQGAAISEMPFTWEPRAHDFPRRNRLISGLSLGVVIVEAARRSGSLITARLAGEQGREVFAVPGSPLDPRSEGANGLLKQGATPVTEAADVIAAIEPILGRGNLPSVQEPFQDPLGSPDAEPDTDERSRLLALLGPAPVSIDDLVRLSRSSATNVRSVLLELEIAGRLVRHGAGLVSLL